MHESLEQRVRRVAQAHLDPEHGSAFWIQRAASRGVEAAEVQSLADLRRLGPTSAENLRSRPLMDFVPRKLHARAAELVIGQTGGTTGHPAWTVYLPEEFDEAFVQPFIAAADHVGFPRGENWLFVGPSGPHIIGQAARAIARSFGSAEPFSVDFDPRWARKLPAESFAASRYLRHVTEQAMAVLDQQPIGVLFATPPALLALADAMTAEQRDRIRGVHYGGLAVGAQVLERLQLQSFPAAVHLAGYGNTLLGCCPELSNRLGRNLDYFPLGQRLILQTVDEDGQPASRGRVSATRLDESFLIVDLPERDHAEQVDRPDTAPAGFELAGLRNPATPAPPSPERAVSTLY